MAFLEQFSDQERDLLASIPYRAGVWVSKIDETGGSQASQEELKRLEAIISEKSRGMFESAFVHEVMAETFARKAEWQGWAKGYEQALEDCTKAVELISGKLEEKDLDAFRANVMGIGLSVAKAFREFEAEASIPVKLNNRIHMLIEAVIRILKRDKSYGTVNELNISFEEDVALTKLSKALHPGLDGSKEDAQISKS